MGMNSGSPTPLPESNAWFVTTHWSVVLSAQDPQAAGWREALESLCCTYWYPLYSYARRGGQSPSDAEDLTQGFFARLLEKNYLKAAARDEGRFRTFLLVALKRYLANEWDRQHAQKRGGFAQFVAIDQDLAESRISCEPVHNLSPDLLFDRQWAMTLLERTMSQLREEYVAVGRGPLFECLRSCVAKEESAMSYAEIAGRVNLTEAAVKMAIHRLRVRYREILRQEVAHTVSRPEEIEEEIRHLFLAFGP
ncbi:MAG TPA: sigma-70 family RNA polymerase sigma factor [Candidatus Baltobacteraceae bacterium]|jgi:RNA polymerase sigma-70 factor (ECF subfamily)|nr:sigma-70 family RNA polymerase sigma factor [Candidatus Baltobacteraceae bacterium]